MMEQKGSFQEKYPETAIGAFIASGHNFFDKLIVSTRYREVLFVRPFMTFSNGDANAKLNFDANTHKLTNGNGSSAANGGGPCPGPTCKEFGYPDYTLGHRLLEVGAKYSF